MELRIFTEPQQGASYDQLLAAAHATERSGLDAFFRSDHYLRIGESPPGGPLPGPTDAWITLAALVRETHRIRFGTLVSAATFRWPGQLAIQAAQVDAMSGGRVEVGIGAGWYREEHLCYGIPFPESVRERFDRLEEYLAIVSGLWSTPVGESFSFSGRHYRLEKCPALPKPVQRPGPPLIVGGHGTRRTPALAARYAAECNVDFPGERRVAGAVFEALLPACEAIGRDPDELTRSVTLHCCIGENEAECRRRADAIGLDVAELREADAGGTVEEVAERLGAYAALGVSRVYLQMLDLTDLDHIALLGERLAPLVADC
jgi:F420-dependent oxidoreductase-like protein